MIDMNLEGRAALVTGGRRGIGGAIAERLAAAGAAVVLAAQSMQDEGLSDKVAALRSKGARADAIAFDLAYPEARIGAIEKAEAFFGPIDILVNNAATNNYAPPSLMDLAYRKHLFEVNVHGPMDLSQQCLPGMKARRYGRILNLSSATIKQTPVPYPGPAHFTHGIAVYGASKAALDRFTLGLASELNGTGIRVNAVMPTSVCVTGANSPSALDALRRHPEWGEGVEMMAEAAMLLICGPLTGRVMKSRDVLLMMQAPLHALDGKTIIGDAHSLPDLG